MESLPQALVTEVGTFLVATAEVLRETIVRFEKTTARITESVVTRPGQADRDLIVTLQDFDRLQQEFLTLAEVLTQAAAKSSEFLVACGGQRSPSGGRNLRYFGRGSQGASGAPTEHFSDGFGASVGRR